MTLTNLGLYFKGYTEPFLLVVDNQLCTEDIELDTLLDAESGEDEADTDEGNRSDGSTGEESSPLNLEKSTEAADSQLLETVDQSSTSTSDTDSVNVTTVQAEKSTSPAVRKFKEMVPILKVFIPLIVFWAVFYQRSSTWIVQATKMDCYLGSLHVPPGKRN